MSRTRRIVLAHFFVRVFSMQQEKSLREYPIRAVQLDDVNAGAEEEQGIDIRALLGKLWRGKWIIGVCILIGAIFGYLTVSQLVPLYRANAKVMFALQQTNVVDVGQDVLAGTGNDRTLINEIEVLRSTSLIERVVDELNLTESKIFNPRLVDRELTLLQRARRIITVPPEIRDILMDLGIVEAPRAKGPPPDPEEVERYVKRIVVSNVLRGVELQPVPGSKVIQMSFTSTNPRMSADVVNTLAEQFILGQLDAKLDATRTATAWLSNRVDELRDRVQLDEQAVEAARSEQSTQSGQSLEITQQQLQALTATLSVARNDTTNALATFERLQEAVEQEQDFGAISEFRASSLIQNYRAREDALVSQRAKLLNSVPETHPSVVRVDTELAEIEENTLAEANSIVEAARSDWIVSLAREQSTEREVRELEDLALSQSRDALQIRQLEREAEASSLLYENFLARLNETSEQEDLQSADARILSPAEIPLRSLSTTKNRTMAASLVIGALIGIGLVFLLDRLNDTFRSPLQVEDVVGLPVLGTMPAVGRRMNRIDVVRRFRENPKSSLAESVRNLRTSILFSNVDKPPQVVLFTSSIPREGKSTTSVLVAMTSRQMGKSSIIVDCDLRLPALARILDANDDKPGLLSLVEGTADLDDAIFIDPETGLHVLMTKPSEPRSNVNAADILSSKRFEELINELKKRYDRVILDAPPTLVVADARILAAYADTVVYAIRWDSTPRGAVLEGIKELRNVSAPIAGIVVTLMNESKASRYTYEGYSYYKGRYKDYYVS